MITAMKVDDSQKSLIKQWIEEGADIAQIQKRMNEEWQASLTYMETRFLIDDLELELKDKPKEVSAAETDITKQPPQNSAELDDDVETHGGVSVTVDALTRPGAAISGDVTFSDGKTIPWQLDPYGRLGLIPEDKDYRPPQEDMQAFQMELQKELSKKGF